jgi:hypothetical protein
MVCIATNTQAKSVSTHKEAVREVTQCLECELGKGQRLDSPNIDGIPVLLKLGGGNQRQFGHKSS